MCAAKVASEARAELARVLQTVARRAYERLIDSVARRASDVPLAASAIVFAPHPDDETLGCGGTIARKRAAGARVRIVFLTDGAGAGFGGIDARPYAATRASEARAAAAALGVAAADVTFLGIADGRLGDELARARAHVVRLLEEERPDQVFVPFRKDVHADHVAANRCVREALGCTDVRPAVYEYAIWYWYHWPLVAPRRGESPAGDGRLPALRNARTTLAALVRLREFRARCEVSDVLDDKRRALACHRSQTTRADPAQAWATLGEMGRGRFLDALFGRYELFAAPPAMPSSVASASGGSTSEAASRFSRR